MGHENKRAETATDNEAKQSSSKNTHSLSFQGLFYDVLTADIISSSSTGAELKGRAWAPGPQFSLA